MTQAPIELEVKLPSAPSPSQPLWLLAVVVWQTVLALAMVAAAVAMVTGALFDLTGLGLVLMAGLALAIAVASGTAVPLMLRHRHSGRAIGVMLDYLVLVLAVFITLQAIGVFRGLDALGATFRRAVPLLAIVILGWLLLGQAERFGSRAERVRRAGKWVMIAGAAAVAVRAGVLPGLAEFFVRLAKPRALLPALVAVASGLAFWSLRRSRAVWLFGSRRHQEEALDGFLFVSPNLLGFAAFFAFPLLFSLFVAFTAWDGLTQITWLGPDNFTKIFSLQFATVDAGQSASDVLKFGYSELARFGSLIVGARDPAFWIALRNISLFAITAVPLAVIPAIGLAALLNTKIPGVRLFRAIYFIPSVAGVLGVALIWKQLYNASVGFINYGLRRLFDLINLLPGVEATAPQPQWLSSRSVALWSIVIFFAWYTVGFNTVLFLAGMQGIPGTLYEAAEIDGASPWQKFRKITVPMLRPTTFFVVATTTILALQVFTEPFILMGPQLPPSGPSNATLTPVVHLYQEGFRRFNQGYASALAWVLFLLIFAITLVYFRRQRKSEAGMG
ncbi:MAG: sugar ABC transporter permease [Actinobacteria bacterium]|nr:sugar ABC transporter permease [Actinomycetota bacterium]